MGVARAVAELRAAWVPCLVLGVINAALPMGLVAWGETHIDSSVAGIAQATVPIFTFLLAARFLPHEHVGAIRIAGVGLGFLGVAALAGLDTARRLVGHRRHARGRPLVALVRGGRRLRAAADPRHPRAGPRDGEHARRGARTPSADRPRPSARGARLDAPSPACSGSSSSRRSPASCCSSASCACTAAGSSRS